MANFTIDMKAYEKAYQQGRADAEEEHKVMCESCIHKVSAEDIEQIRADAIDEFVKLCENRYPKNWANEFELGGKASHFSLNDIYSIAEQIGGKSG